jgi:phage FluMu protein Com
MKEETVDLRCPRCGRFLAEVIGSYVRLICSHCGGEVKCERVDGDTRVNYVDRATRVRRSGTDGFATVLT